MEQIGLRYTFGIPGVHNEKLIADNYVEAINMNGAQALMQTLVNAGIEVCFTNPGTSEMHFVAALDSAPGMRAVLCLFEGVATGAADGYARMADKPAATLLHLGCGLGNGLANLHNARKGKVPVVNIVGDHATYHVQYDAQLQSDIETVARNVSPGFVRTSRSTAELCRDAVDAVRVAKGLPGQVATLILPADVSWGAGGMAEPAPQIGPPDAADDATVQAIASVINSGGRTALLLGGRALGESALLAAARIAAKTGIKVYAETFPTRLERGAGLPAVERIAYLAEMCRSSPTQERRVTCRPTTARRAHSPRPSRTRQEVWRNSAAHWAPIRSCRSWRPHRAPAGRAARCSPLRRCARPWDICCPQTPF